MRSGYSAACTDIQHMLSVPAGRIKLHITMKLQITWTKRRPNRFSKMKGIIKCTPPRKKKVAECHLSIIKPGNWKSGEWCFPKENHLLHGIVCPNYQKKKVREENHIFSNMTCKVSEKGTALCSQEAAKGCAPPKPGRNPGEQDVRLREQGLQPQRQSMGVTKVTIKENSR